MKKYLFVFGLLLLILTLLFVRFRIYKIDGTSMNYGLVQGDIVLCKRHFDKISRGDLLVFYLHEKTDDALFIKRCVALPGDIFFEKNRSFYLQIEGNSTKTWKMSRQFDLDVIQTDTGYFLKNPYLKYYGVVHNRNLIVPAPLTHLPRSQLPKGYYYMLGDYRDNSADSRFFGAIPRKQITSKVIFIFKKSRSWMHLLQIQEADKAPVPHHNRTQTHPKPDLTSLLNS